jgi:hippurate hydrolase
MSKIIKPKIFTGLLPVFLFSLFSSFTVASDNLSVSLKESIKQDYSARLKDLFEDFHANPELSSVEFKTAEKLAIQLRNHGYEVTEGIGGTGLVAILKNGPGPLVMMRADMDGLPIKEKTQLSYASKVEQLDPFSKMLSPVMHACGHDVHITSLIGTAKQMAERRDQWSGTLMLIGQPAEERLIGAQAMMDDNLWQRFGTPDYALAFHVAAGMPVGTLNVQEGSPFAGADSVDIIVHGVGAHGASPHAGKDPIVLASQIVLSLQTLISRELAPKQPGVITVGAFNAGSKHNIIPESAHLKVTVRNSNLKTRELLLAGIERITKNLGRAAGLPEDKLPEVIYGRESTPPTINNTELVQRLRAVWQKNLGENRVNAYRSEGMGAEDFPAFTTIPEIPSVYFAVGGTSLEDIIAARSGTGPAIASHHSPMFKVEPQESVITGVFATVTALFDLMPVQADS